MPPRLLAIAATAAMVGCAAPEQRAQAEGETPLPLRVSLFPWVPEASSMFRWIEQDFESRHPDIDLVMRDVAKSSDTVWGDLSYDLHKTIPALTTDGPDRQDLIEIDAMGLAALGMAGAIVPFELRGVAFLPAAAEAVRWNGAVYGVPHWTCGYFLIAEDPAVVRAGTITELLAALRALGTQRPDVVGDLGGSWDAIMLYLDGLRDTDPNADMRSALTRTTLDATAAGFLDVLGAACTRDGTNRCDGDWAELFAHAGADAFVGYSERLHAILTVPGRTVGELHVASAPLGNGDQPTLFVDALVRSPQCDTPACQYAARRFAEYYVSDTVFSVVLMAQDVSPAATPRYLLPSTETAFGAGLVAADRLYRALHAEIGGARPYPSAGVPEARDRGLIRAQVRRALRLPQ